MVFDAATVVLLLWACYVLYGIRAAIREQTEYWKKRDGQTDDEEEDWRRRTGGNLP